MNVKVRWLDENTYQVVGGNRDFWTQYNDTIPWNRVVTAARIAEWERAGVEVTEV